MAARACVFIVTLMLASSTALERPRELVVWNVGQGLWVTIVDDVGCWHFDMGGEFAPWSAVMELCRARRNFVSLSHWDWDHISFAGRAAYYLPDLCVLIPPGGEAAENKMRMLRRLRECGGGKIPFAYWSGDPQAARANERSTVVAWRGAVIPGDSTRTQEKKWSQVLPLADVRYLILGHHGSATSTGKDLLVKLRSVQIAIASARFKRYGHPHRRVENDLRERGIPLLRTEDWGTIRIRLD